MAIPKELKKAAFTEKIKSFADGSRERMLNALELADERSAGAALLALELGLDEDALVAALLLNRFRESPLSETDAGRFGEAAISLVRGVIKIDSLRTDNQTIQEAQNIRNMLIAVADDIRVIIIKLAEKLCALRTLDACDGEERKTAARECLDIYAPLADRLGISWIKNEMEDLSLKFLNREAYQQIKDIVAEKRDLRDQFLEQAREAVIAEARAAGLQIETESRAKHFYSVYMKMRKRGKSAGDIFDLSGIRIICGSIENCYTLLGIVHRLWKPINGCFKDYIARPKPNGYMSLHTSVTASVQTPDAQTPQTAPEGRLLEIQIRTTEMHRIAENGVASHWLYKKGSSRDLVHQADIGIVNRLKDWKQEGPSQNAPGISSSWLSDIKGEIFRKSIYVFTPQGKVIKLPTGATPIDFAYRVHSAIGEHCIGAKADGSIIPLSSQLKNAQSVEILTSPSAHPHANWLSLAKTAKARNKIRSWLERNSESRSIEKAIKEKKKVLPETPAVSPASEREVSLQRVIQPPSSVLKVRIEDHKNILIRFARCCNPVAGDSIIGYVSRGRGIIIHRKNCPNFANNPEVENRAIRAEWEHEESALLKRFRIEARRSADLFMGIEGAIRKRQGHLLDGRLEENAAGRLAGIFTIQLERADDLKALIKNIRGIPGIISISNIPL